jgi:type I restriction enzyme S subunit
MSEWKKDILQNYTSLITKGTTPTSLGKAFQENGINFIKAESITDSGNFIHSAFAFIDNETHEILKRSQLFDGDILFSIAGVLGRVAIVNTDILPANTNQAIALIRLPNSSMLEKDFLKYYLNSPFIKDQIRRINVQAAQANFSLGDINRLVVNFPTSLAEQRKIARILSTVDAVIEKTEAAIAKYKAIKSGMMRDLFTRGIDLKTGKLRPRYEEAPELYKQSELGWVPREWAVENLENSTDYVDYRGKTPPKSEFGIFLVTARNIKEGFIDYENSKEYIPEYAYEPAMSRGKAEIGDVVITTEAPMGNVAQIDRANIALAQRVIKYRGKSNKLINDFLASFLMTDIFQRRLIAESTGSTVLGIKGSRLHKLFVAIPEKNEQFAISKIIKAQDTLIASENDNLHKHQYLKSALMSDLLTGKVRVKYDENENVEAV